MRVLALLLAVLSLSSADRVVGAHGVRLVVPPGWQRVRAASDAPVTDPRTLLVVGTAGVKSRASQCRIARYRIPAAGAVIVVVAWKKVVRGAKDDRRELQQLRGVTRPVFECFAGRGAVADVVLGGRTYQVNLMVGDRAAKARVAEALRVARSFDLVR